MKELSLNILDIAENSAKAGAKRIGITVVEDVEADLLTIEITDDGCGMEEDFLRRVTDPFTTTRSTRPVGMGIPLFKEAAESTGGSFQIKSQVGKGTCVTAVFTYSHIDRMPLGDMAGTIATLIQCHPEIDFLYRHRYRAEEFTLDTVELREVLGGVSLAEPDVALWIRGYLTEQINELYGG